MPVLEQVPALHPRGVHRNSGMQTLSARMFGLDALLALSVAVLILVAIPRTMADPDIWWHLRNAEDMLLRHAFVRTDTLSFTVRGAPWIDHEWLGELAFYAGWKAAGSAGVYAVKSLLIEGIFLPLLWLCWRASNSALTACAATILAALVSTVSFGPRTLLFGWLCLVVELVVLELFRTRPAAALLLPPVFLLWVNLHGSWMIGLAVLAVVTVAGHPQVQHGWIAQERWTRGQSRKLLLAWLGVVPALFCNPWGWRLVAYPFNFAFHQTLNVANVQEWHSLDLHSFRGRVVVAVVLLIVARQVWKPRTWSVSELALLLLGFYSAFAYTRFLFLLALLAAPLFARSVPSRNAAARDPGLLPVNALLMLVIAAFAVGYVRHENTKPDDALDIFPGAALPALAQLPTEARVMNEFLWGGYLEMHRHEHPVFIDSRVDIFEYSGVFKDYLDIIHIQNTLALLDRYRIDYVLFEKDTPLVYLLSHTGGWVTTYDDGKTVLLKRGSRVEALAWQSSLAVERHG